MLFDFLVAHSKKNWHLSQLCQFFFFLYLCLYMYWCMHFMVAQGCPEVLAEKEITASWILANNHLLKDNKWFLGYILQIIIWYLNHVKLSKWKVWNKFLTSLIIGVITTSKVIEIKSCFEHLFSMFSYHVLHLPSCKCKTW